MNEGEAQVSRALKSPMSKDQLHFGLKHLDYKEEEV